MDGTMCFRNVLNNESRSRFISVKNFSLYTSVLLSPISTFNAENEEEYWAFHKLKSQLMVLYQSQLYKELCDKNLPVPEFIYRSISVNSLRLLQKLNQEFMNRSLLRAWVAEQAQNVDVLSLTWTSFQAIANDLFNVSILMWVT